MEYLEFATYYMSSVNRIILFFNSSFDILFIFLAEYVRLECLSLCSVEVAKADILVLFVS